LKKTRRKRISSKAGRAGFEPAAGSTPALT
jgi:hypothetical protein